MKGGEGKEWGERGGGRKKSNVQHPLPTTPPSRGRELLHENHEEDTTMKKTAKAAWVAVMSLILWTYVGSMAYAHFQMIIPSDEMVSQAEKREITLDVVFTRPFEGHGMNLVKP